MEVEASGLSAQLQALENGAGAELLDSSDAGALSRLGAKIQKARTEHALLISAIALSIKREADAELAWKRSEIEGLRAEAATKRSSIADLEKKTSKLLGELGILEGVSYTSVILQAQPVSGYIPADNVPLQLCSPGEMLGDRTCAAHGVSLSRRLFNEALALEAQARTKENELEKSLAAAPPFISGRSPGWNLALGFQREG